MKTIKDEINEVLQRHYGVGGNKVLLNDLVSLFWRGVPVEVNTEKVRLEAGMVEYDFNGKHGSVKINGDTLVCSSFALKHDTPRERPIITVGILPVIKEAGHEFP